MIWLLIFTWWAVLFIGISIFEKSVYVMAWFIRRYPLTVLWLAFVVLIIKASYP